MHLFVLNLLVFFVWNYVSFPRTAPYAAADDDSADDESTATSHTHSARVKIANSAV